MSSGTPIVSGGLAPSPDGLSLASDGLLFVGSPTGMTPFEALEGVSQARVEEGGGLASFWIGQSQEGHFADLAPGDFSEVWQDADLSGQSLVRFSGTFEAPRSTPSDRRWRLALLLDGAEGASILGWPGYQRQIDDLALDVTQLSGIHRVAVRLSLEAC